MFTKIPTSLMEDLRTSIGLDSDDISRDQQIFNMSKKEILHRVMEVYGFIPKDEESEIMLQLKTPESIDKYCDDNCLFGLEGPVKLILALA